MKLESPRSLLTKEERARYECLARTLLPGEKRNLRSTYTWGWGLWAAVAVPAYFVIGSTTGLGVVASIGAVSFPFLIGVPWVWISLAYQARSERALARQTAEYLLEIGYAGRKPRSTGGSVGNDEGRHYYTNGYEPDRWFSYSSDERNFMRDRGMNADVYDSNVRDHDPS